MAGQCAAAVRRTGRRGRITAASVRDAYAAWTTIAPGEKMSSVHVVCIHPFIGALYFSIISHHTYPQNNSPQPFSPLFLWLWWIRINNCVGELNQKYFIQFLFYTGEYLQYVYINAAVMLQPFVILGQIAVSFCSPVLFLFKMC